MKKLIILISFLIFSKYVDCQLFDAKPCILTEKERIARKFVRRFQKVNIYKGFYYKEGCYYIDLSYEDFKECRDICIKGRCFFVRYVIKKSHEKYIKYLYFYDGKNLMIIE